MQLEPQQRPYTAPAALTSSQQQLLSGVMQERSDQCIAKEMGITAPTVRFRLTYLFRLFDVSDRQTLISRLKETRGGANGTKPLK